MDFDKSSKINDPSAPQNRQSSEEAGRKRVIPPEERDTFKQVLSKEEERETRKKNKELSSKEDSKKSGKHQSLFDLSGQVGRKKEKSSKLGQAARKTGDDPFAQEQPDLSVVNPLKGQEPGIVSSLTSQAGSAKGISPEMTLLIDKIADEISIMKQKGQTDTTITLNQPPLFKGATLTLRAFETARGEFNIKFEGLTLEAKALIDLPINQQSLKTDLAEKGYVMHILTATTEMPKAEGTNAEQQFARDQEGEEQQQQREQEDEEEA